ncbi:hypothetical protein [Cellulosimicrobium sp. Marseille-Q4280]|uniref:hypothetical protein n=1 Tax=Cellulosimicrobium sp. Marseille-Q4280 TaxID=2937992 RepID=UPI00204201D9|nr:hypothetical protein [Cellulosimicrobium sp. Marseille-Q4280]
MFSAIYFLLHAGAVLAVAVAALSVVVYPVLLVRARGNPVRAASMELEFAFAHPGWSILIAVAVTAGAWFAWDHLYEPEHTDEGRPYAAQWSVQAPSGGARTTFETDTEALSFACNTTLGEDGFVLRSDRGYEQEYEPGSDVCHRRYYVDRDE